MVSAPITLDPSAAIPLELLEPTEMADADRLAAETIPSNVLMQHAGEAVAQAARRCLAPIAVGRPAQVAVLCGPGNNGGDGYVAARLLAATGCGVVVASLVDRASLKGDAAEAAGRWSGPVLALDDVMLDGVDLVIDALFGAGLARDIEGVAASVLQRLNDWSDRRHRPVLAVDIPSGIDGVSGAVRGIAVRATHTITFFRLKPGHLLMPGRMNCGVLSLADIGISAEVLSRIQPRTWLNGPGLWARLFPVPKPTGHKYGRGHAVVVSGPPAQTGAARLAARGALRGGAGLVTVATPAEALNIHAVALTAIMTRVADGASGLRDVLSDRRKNAVVLGPGLGIGSETRALVETALAPTSDAGPPRHVVLDADALSSFAETPQDLFRAIDRGEHTVVLTPHDGEFAKLFGALVETSQAKPQRARAAAAMSGATIVLKGPDTVVAHPDGRAAIAVSNAPWLATAGSGDVLAGIICGLLAQAMPPFEAAAAAVWLHSEAARLFGPGLISEDLPDLLPRVFSNLLAHGLIDET